MKAHFIVEETSNGLVGGVLGTIWTTPGNLRSRETAWWGREDSNFQPNHYLPLVLSSLWDVLASEVTEVLGSRVQAFCVRR